MPKCKECEKSYGLFELSSGICKSCINKKTPDCRGCGKPFDIDTLNEGFCHPCYTKELNNRHLRKVEREQSQKAIEIESLSELDLKNIILTTESSHQIEIEERIDIITAECAFGMNIFKDLFSGVRDVIGGRSSSTQNILRDSRKTVLNELRKEAYAIGANAVVGVNLSYSEFSGGNKSMLFVVASGTAVKAKL